MTRWPAAIVILAAIARSVAGQNFSWAVTDSIEGSNKIFLEQLEEAQAGNGSRLVIYGDSKLACLQFEAYGCEGATEVRDKRFGHLKPLVWAVGGDSPATVMGRLLSGLVPTELGSETSDVVVAMQIGHNGLGNGEDIAADRIKEVAQYIIDADKQNHVVWISMLPSSQQWVGSGMYAPSKYVDSEVKAYFEDNKDNDRLHFADCESMLLSKENPDYTNETLMPDFVHLGPLGYEVLADCLDPFIRNITGQDTGELFSMPTPSKYSSSSSSSNTTTDTMPSSTPWDKDSNSSSNSTATYTAKPAGGNTTSSTTFDAGNSSSGGGSASWDKTSGSGSASWNESSGSGSNSSAWEYSGTLGIAGK